MPTLSFSNPALAALERRHYKVASVLDNRDKRQVTMVSASSPMELIVTEFASEPDFFDVSYESTLPCESAAAELELRKAFDVESDDHPFVKINVHVALGNATIRHSATHELPKTVRERRALADFYVRAFLEALSPNELPGAAEITTAA